MNSIKPPNAGFNHQPGEGLIVEGIQVILGSLRENLKLARGKLDHFAA